MKNQKGFVHRGGVFRLVPEKRMDTNHVVKENLPIGPHLAAPKVGATNGEAHGGGNIHTQSNRQRPTRLFFGGDNEEGPPRRPSEPDAHRNPHEERSCAVGDRPRAAKAMLRCSTCEFVTVHTRDTQFRAWWRCDECATTRHVLNEESAIILDDGGPRARKP